MNTQLLENQYCKDTNFKLNINKNNFAVKIVGDSMIDFGINHGDLVIASKSTKDKLGKIVIASLNREITIKKLDKIGSDYALIPGNSKYKPRIIEKNDILFILGEAQYIIKDT